MTTWSSRASGNGRQQRLARPYCTCQDDGKPRTLANPGGCQCGEYFEVKDWKWQLPESLESSWVLMSEDQKQVTFHPFYSSGTAMVLGTKPLAHNYHYYWEVKMITEAYGTDVQVGIGTKKVDLVSARYSFTSLLGSDKESYGLSYAGSIRHSNTIVDEGLGFCKGSIIGVKVDLWHGSVQFFLNRESRGDIFFNLRKHPSETLFPMLSSTAAQSTFRLIYAGSWCASLLVDAAKILGASVTGNLPIPPGMRHMMKESFWLTLPNDTAITDEKERTSRKEVKPVTYKQSTIAESLESPEYAHLSHLTEQAYNGYYTDNIEEAFRIALVYEDL